MKSNLRLRLLAAWLIALSTSAGAQDQEPPAEPNAESLINDAFAKSKAAKTVEDFTSLIDTCDRIRAVDLSESQTKYIDKLTAWGHNRRGELYSDQSAELAAKREAEKATELDTLALADFVTAVRKDPTRWKAVHNRGVSYAMLGKYQEAIADFSYVIRVNPNFTLAWFNRGEAQYALTDFEKAVEDYNRVLRLNPNDSAAYVSRGHTNFQLKRFRQALADYDLAVRLDAESGETRANRADAYQSLGMWERAAADYRRAIELDDKLGRAYQSAAWLLSTCPDEQFRDTKLALEAANRAVELIGKEDHLCLDTLAAAQANAGKFDEAKATLTTAIEKAPENKRESLNRRLKLYDESKPFRQGMFRSQ